MLHEGDGLVVAELEFVQFGDGEGDVELGFEFEEGGFDGSEAVDTPDGGGSEADGVGFGLVGRFEGLRVGVEMERVGFFVFVVDDGLSAGEAVFAGVEGGDAFAFFGDGSGGRIAGGHELGNAVDLFLVETTGGIDGGEFIGREW